MSGIWLLLWIVWVFFCFGVGVGRWLERRQKTPGVPKAQFDPRTFLNPSVYLNPFVFMVPLVILNTLESIVKAGWVPKTPVISGVLGVCEVICGIIATAYLALAIAHIITERRGRRL